MSDISPSAFVVTCLLISHADIYPTVTLPTLFYRVVGHGKLLSVAFGRESRLWDPQSYKFVERARSTVLRELEVVCRITSVIGVATNLQCDLRIGLQDRCHVCQLFLG